MKDPRTTLIALITGITGMLSYWGIIIPEGWTEPIVMVGVILLGYFASDKKDKD